MGPSCIHFPYSLTVSILIAINYNIEHNHILDRIWGVQWLQYKFTSVWSMCVYKRWTYFVCKDCLRKKTNILCGILDLALTLHSGNKHIIKEIKLFWHYSFRRNNVVFNSREPRSDVQSGLHGRIYTWSVVNTGCIFCLYTTNCYFRIKTAVQIVFSRGGHKEKHRRGVYFDGMFYISFKQTHVNC